MSGRWRLTVRTEFSASHRLICYRGKCENPHGHNFGVEAEVEGRELDEAGMVLDFGELKRMLGEIVDALDHADLNELPAFKGASPSSENIARHVYAELKNRLAERPVRLVRVMISEKAAQQAEYFED
jgi:6-pyruvoyltetrahydropterin/6-carboxytetrahydropterin synthase